MNFKTFLKFTKIQYQKFLLETGLLKTRPEIWSTFIQTYVCWRTFKLCTMLKQLLNGNNELLLNRTPNNTDLSLPCHC